MRVAIEMGSIHSIALKCLAHVCMILEINNLVHPFARPMNSNKHNVVITANFFHSGMESAHAFDEMEQSMSFSTESRVVVGVAKNKDQDDALRFELGECFVDKPQQSALLTAERKIRSDKRFCISLSCRLARDQ